MILPIRPTLQHTFKLAGQYTQMYGTPMDNTPLHSKPSVCRPWGSLLLILFGHCAKSSTAQEERLATSLQFVTTLHQLHAIVVRFRVLKTNAIILPLETAGSFRLSAVAHPCRLDFPVSATGGSLPC